MSTSECMSTNEENINFYIYNIIQYMTYCSIYCRLLYVSTVTGVCVYTLAETNQLDSIHNYMTLYYQLGHCHDKLSRIATAGLNE